MNSKNRDQKSWLSARSSCFISIHNSLFKLQIFVNNYHINCHYPNITQINHSCIYHFVLFNIIIKEVQNLSSVHMKITQGLEIVSFIESVHCINILGRNSYYILYKEGLHTVRYKYQNLKLSFIMLFKHTLFRTVWAPSLLR